MSENRGFLLKWVGERVKGAPLFISIPDTGLVSLLSAINMVSSKKIPLIAYIDAEWIPPVISITDGYPTPPLRIYSYEKLLILLSEVPLPPESWKNLPELISTLFTEMDVSMVIGATGLPNPKRYSLEKLRMFISYTNKELKDKYLKELPEFSGLLSGPYALIMKSLLFSEKPGILLIIDSYPNYPDPEAAATIVKTVGGMINDEFDVSQLLKKASELKLMARKLAAEIQRVQPESGTVTGRPSVSFYM